MLSQAAEDYLKAIYKLQTEGQATTNAIAKALGVSSASVTNMLKRLAQMKLVQYTSHRGATLTDAGRKVALEVIRHHRLLELYLSEILGYSWDEVPAEAEQLEHHISEQFEDKIDALLGHPTHDPHGDPIPTKDGHIPEDLSVPLTDIPAQQTVVIRRVYDGDPELLQYLAKMQLIPDTVLKVSKKEPFNGPLTLAYRDDEQIIGHQVASQIFVLPHEA